jgi:AraC-like DNA-binding protein
MDARIRVILRIIEEQNGPGPLTSMEAGRLLGVSAAYFLRLFHQEANTTFGRYHLEVRMARAAALVRDHTVPIKSIAFDTGYQDLSNFYRDFRQVHGISPRQMRLTHDLMGHASTPLCTSQNR